MYYQETLFGQSVPCGFIKDKDCTKDTPVLLGVKDTPIYGKGVRIKPRIPGREDTEHFRSIYLPELLPLEEYDLIALCFSGGKDSLACYIKLLELGVPREKIELWHHDIDGGHPTRQMDWKCTQNYVRSFAEAEGVPLRVSWRKNGFFGELYRIGASEVCEWEDPDTGEIFQCKPTKNQVACDEIRKSQLSEWEQTEELKKYGFRNKFPAKCGDLSSRWCSAYLKIMVTETVLSNLDRLGELERIGGKRQKFPAKGGTHDGRWCSGALKASVQDSVISNLEATKSDKKILVVSGERRGESAGRSRYNEMELHRTNATAKCHRVVHLWRAVIDYSEKDVWELIRRGTGKTGKNGEKLSVACHPCYLCGWNRCSCSCCIFSLPSQYAGIRELFPEQYELLKKDEQILNFTIDNTRSLDEYVGSAKSCVFHGDTKALYALKTGVFTPDDVYVPSSEWHYPAGAFHGAEGGPC